MSTLPNEHPDDNTDEQTPKPSHTVQEALHLLNDPDDWAHAFFTAYTGPIGYGTLNASFRHAGITRQNYRTRLENDTVFALLKTEADNELRDAVRHELMNRALNGTQRPIFQRGHLVGHVREVDNRLLMWLAERLIPEEYHLATKFELTGDNAPGAFKFAMGEVIEQNALEEGDPE